jgi:heavy metal sensor kinase
MIRLPIRLRVTAAFALAMAAVLAGSGFFLYGRLGSHLALALDNELRIRAQDLSTLVVESKRSLARESGGLFIERGESYAQALDARGNVVDATRPLGTAPLLDHPQLRRAQHRALWLDRSSVPGLNEPSRLLATPVESTGRRLVLVVGATLQDRAETLASFRDELLVAGPIALVLASLVGYLLAGLSLRQVESMRKRAAEISAETAGERLPIPASGDELQRLGETLNKMLDRLEAALERERDFVADAGHELRTPLAILRTELELALRQAKSAEELREAMRWSAQEVDRVSRLAEDLLLIARSDRDQLPLRLERLDVNKLFASVLRRFEWRVQETGTSIRAAPCPEVSVQGDSLRLEQALGNLIDNALRHGAGAICLTARAADRNVELHVTDEGPGFEHALLRRAFERFTRSDSARSRGGAGLGLPIALAIAQAHGGTANAMNANPRGADVWLALPTIASAHEPRSPGE